MRERVRGEDGEEGQHKVSIYMELQIHKSGVPIHKRVILFLSAISCIGIKSPFIKAQAVTTTKAIIIYALQLR